MKSGLPVALAALVAAACGPVTPRVMVDATDGETETDFEPTTGPTLDTETGPAACGAGLLQCGGSCVDPHFDPSHCGGCNIECSDTEVCLDGACSFVCGPGTEQCGERCVDTSVDPQHCGACDRACFEGASCMGGECILNCEPEQTQCGEECVDLHNDENNCGECGTACADGIYCVFSKCVDASLHHIMITGQSLSVGQQSGVVSTSQPYDNVRFIGGVRVEGDDTSAFAPLYETQSGIFGETIASGMANQLTELTATDDHDGLRFLVSAHGVSSASYAELARGTAPYVRGMAHAIAGGTLAGESGETYAIRGVVAIHGERDHVEGNLFYDDDLIAWQADYQADVRAVVGQDYEVPLFVCQMSSWTHYDSATSVIPIAQLEASRRAPDRIVLIGPKYFLPYVDGLHLTGDGERELGEYYAKAMRKVLVDGESWIPLSPRDVQRIGRVIDVEFHVPAPPLVLDTMSVADPGNYGFEYFDSSDAPPVIESVELTGPTSVRITLSEAPTAGNRRLRYAYTAVPGAPSGAMTGARGNLRDSDTTPSRSGLPLYNWAVHFDEPVP